VDFLQHSVNLDSLEMETEPDCIDCYLVKVNFEVGRN